MYGEFLQEERARQEARKESFERRGLAVLTTAGTLVTLLFGLAALSKRSTHIGGGEADWLKAALALFLLSAFSALATNFPVDYRQLDADAFKPFILADPEHSDARAWRAVTKARLSLLEVAQRANDRKGSLLFGALVLEVLAVLCVGIAIFQVVTMGGNKESHHAPVPSAHHHHHHTGLD